MRVPAGVRLVLGCCLAVSTLGGCAGTQDDAAGSAAQDFLEAVGARDGGDACSLMAPAARAELASSSGKPCDEAVLEEDLFAAPSPASTRVVEVYDSMAQVRLDSETLFLSRFDGEWLVVAAACSARPGDQPYDCSIQVS